MIAARFFASMIALFFATSVHADSCHVLSHDVLSSVISISDDNYRASGVVVAPNRIVTAAHVIEDMPVPMVNINGIPQEATIVLSDPTNDIALLEANTAHLMPIPLLGRHLEMHDEVWAVGFPLGGEQAANFGQVTEINRGEFHSSATIHNGQSGGGMLTCENGNYVLAGMITAFTAIRVGNKWIPQHDDSISLSILNVEQMLRAGEEQLYLALN